MRALTYLRLFIADRDRVEWVVMGAALAVWIGMCIAGVAA